MEPTSAGQDVHPDPLPSPPFITHIPGLFNLRSIGSLPVSSSSSNNNPNNPNNPSSLPAKQSTRNHIYRSGDPSKLASADTSALHDELGIRTIFDLRSRSEARHASLAAIPGIEQRLTPVFENRDMDPAELARTVARYGDSAGIEGFVASYVGMLEAGRNAFAAFFRHLLVSPREGVLVHCTAGKDRTGVVVALVLELAGVEVGVIADEYALTDVGLGEWREGVVLLLLKSPGLEGDEVKIRRMLSARREVMVAFLERLRNDFGGAKGYLIEKLGFTEDEVVRIRANIVQENET